MSEITWNKRDDDSLNTPAARLAGPLNLVKPNDDGKHTCRLLFKKGENMKVLKAECEALARKAFGTLAGVKMPWRDQAEKNGYEGYEAGAEFLTPTGKRRPGFRDANRGEVLNIEETFYAGCWVRANIKPFSYDHPKSGKGVGLGLNHLQFLKNDEPFSNAISADDAFDAVDMGGDANGSEDLFG